MTHYISSIQLDDIRSFRGLSISIETPRSPQHPAPHTILIGKNGTCKTSVLRSIAIGLCHSWDGNALAAESIGRLVAEDSPTGKITLGLKAGQKRIQVVTNLKNDGKADEDYVTKSSLKSTWKSPLVCGYGVARSVGEGLDIARAYRIADSAYSLFNYHQTLTGAEVVLRRLKASLTPAVYEKVEKAIKAIAGLSEDDDEIIVEDRGGVYLRGPSIGQKISLDGFADGQGVVMKWILDMYGWALRVEGALDKKTGKLIGILLIDEIEQNLHPSLQNKILWSLRHYFPQLQVIATTHSPVVALNAEPNEIVVLRRDGDGVHPHTPPDTSSYSVEDLLADSDLMDGPRYKFGTQEELNEYHNLLGQKELSASDKARLRKLGSILTDKATGILGQG